MCKGFILIKVHHSAMDGPNPKRRKFAKPFCPHCGLNVSKSTFYRHFNEFYNKSTDTWTKNQPSEGTSAAFVFSSSSDCDSGESATETHYEEQEEDVDEQESQHSGEDNNDLEIWESDSDSDSDEGQVTELCENVSSVTKFINFICVFILAWHTIFRIPNVAICDSISVHKPVI